MRTPARTPRVVPEFYPLPAAHNRGILRWLLLIFHVIPFAVVVFIYPTIAEQLHSLIDRNLIQLGLGVWCGLILLHFTLVALLDLRETLQYGWRERRRRVAYRKQHGSHQFKVWSPPEVQEVSRD